MKKSELVHLHGLGALINEGLAWGTDVIDPKEEFEPTPRLAGDAEDHSYLQEYGERGVYPTSIHKSKTDHKHAAMELFRSIADRIEEVDSSGDGLDPVERALARAEDRRNWRRSMEQIYDKEVAHSELRDPERYAELDELTQGRTTI